VDCASMAEAMMAMTAAADRTTGGMRLVSIEAKAYQKSAIVPLKAVSSARFGE
jgi:hypothetical protein